MNLVTSLPVAATLIPRIKNKFRGIMILAALILKASVGYLYLNPQGPLTINLGLLILLFPVGLILFGGLLVLLSR